MYGEKNSYHLKWGHRQIEQFALNSELWRSKKDQNLRTADTTNDTVCSISSEGKMDLALRASMRELVDEVGVLRERVEEEDGRKFTFMDFLDHGVLFFGDRGQYILLVDDRFEFLGVCLRDDDLFNEARVLFGERVGVVLRCRMSHEANGRHRSTQYSIPTLL